MVQGETRGLLVKSHTLAIFRKELGLRGEMIREDIGLRVVRIQLA